ncbi:sigma E protease regulator RseP [Aliidiomarina celeris]|uniref:sigma E protease regulator RseP n=1 Tax=Aliidiomarina celeris TaxID=2249428 RepID=UPI003F7CE1E4
MLWSIGAFIVALGLVVTFHEFGHFWVARRCGVKVLTFSIGFGKPLFKWLGKDGTQYQIAAVPLGGYVRMLDHEIDPTKDAEVQQSFRSKSLGQRAAVVVAGPVANFIFAIAALWLMLMIGVPSVKPIVGAVEENSVAQRAGLPVGSEILSVDGHRVYDWQDINLRLVARMGDAQTRVEAADSAGSRNEYVLDLTEWQFDPETQSTIGSLGIQVFQPEALTELAWIAEGSPAAVAGLRQRDKITKFNGTPVTNWEQIRAFIAERPNEQITLTLEREGREMDVAVRLGAENGRGLLGVAPAFEQYPEAYRFSLQYGPIGAFVGGVERTWQLMGLSVSMIKKLIVGDMGVNNLSGPIGIAQGAGTHASYGLVYFLSFLALISVSLGILNLLPIPMLDGGHLLFYFIEWVRGRPVPERVQELGFRIGLMLLVMLMMVAVFNDINRLLP